MNHYRLFPTMPNRMPNHVIAIVLIMTALACHAAPPAPLPAPPRLPRGYVPATRSGPECDAAKARTASLPVGTLDGLQSAQPRTVPLPPLRPRFEAKVVVTLRVDETGVPMRDSIFITGSTDQTFVRDYVDGIRKTRFWPAVLDGCNVTARWTMDVNLGTRR